MCACELSPAMEEDSAMEEENPIYSFTQPNLKGGQYLEWYTSLPSRAHHRHESPPFLLKSNEWVFEFSYHFKSASKCYEACLILRKQRTVLESHRVRFQVGFTYAKTSNLHKGQFAMADLEKFWSIPADELRSKLPSECTISEGIKFVFYFENVPGPIPKTNKETDGIAVQTPKYMYTHFLMEDVLKDFSQLFDEGLDPDVQFICGHEIIKAHKSILCRRSDVFASMFQSDVQYSFVQQVTIQDVEGSIFRQFLRFLYTGEFPELTADIATRLFEVADKYDIDVLKTQCISFLVENISLDNACDILIMSDRYGDPNYKKTVMEYVIKEKIQFMEEKWTDLCKKCPTLASEVFSLFCQKLQENTKKPKQ